MKIKTTALMIILSAVMAGGLSAVVPASSESVPAFIFKPIRTSSGAMVSGIHESVSADVVLLNGGFDKGFGVGMTCDIIGEDGKNGEVILVDVKRSKAAALILKLEDGSVISKGDVAKIKTLTLAN